MTTVTTQAVSAATATTESPYIQVPETTLPGGIVVPAFEVGRYLCSLNRGVVITADRKPAARISYHEAVAACEKSGLRLIRETQALALAYNVSQVGANWTGGEVGSGMLKQGLRLTHGAIPGSFVHADADQDRWFLLPNGERICDAAGNLFTWVFDDVQGDEQGIVARAFAEDSPSIATAPHPRMTKGMGWRPEAGDDWSGSALARGGCWDGGDRAGVFNLVGVSPGSRYGRVGFRCTK